MRYDRRSLAVMGVFVAAAGVLTIFFGDLIEVGQEPDWLLMGCWAGMVALSAANVAPARDVPLALAALAGGAFIETWGTHAGLWSYFTGERPPLFILPAWPAAAVATARVADAVHPFVARRASGRIPFLVVGGAFTAALVHWTSRVPLHPSTVLALGAVGVVLATSRDGARDVARFGAGCLTGLPLEIWGTTRACWTYAGGGTPPLIAVLSHGFATVAFDRGAEWLARLARRPAQSLPT